MAIEDITHYGPPRFLQVPSMLDGLDAVHEWAVSIMLDPAAEDERMRVAHLVVNDGGPADAYLTGAQGLAYADELRRFADDVQKLSAECIEPLGTALC